jgi:hypothetical protein
MYLSSLFFKNSSNLRIFVIYSSFLRLLEVVENEELAKFRSSSKEFKFLKNSFHIFLLVLN